VASGFLGTLVQEVGVGTSCNRELSTNAPAQRSWGNNMMQAIHDRNSKTLFDALQMTRASYFLFLFRISDDGVTNQETTTQKKWNRKHLAHCEILKYKPSC